MIGDLKLYLGLEIEKGKNSYFMSQSKYINDLLIRYNMTNCKPSKYPMDIGYFKVKENNPFENTEVYQGIIGSLLYLAFNTRPDILARCKLHP